MTQLGLPRAPTSAVRRGPRVGDGGFSHFSKARTDAASLDGAEAVAAALNGAAMCLSLFDFCDGGRRVITHRPSSRIADLATIEL